MEIQLLRIKMLPELERVFDKFYDRLMEKLQEEDTSIGEKAAAVTVSAVTEKEH